METFALYLIKSASWLSGFALVWYIFLRNERYFLLKRIYLNAGLLISIIFPFITIRYQVEIPVREAGIAVNYMTSAGQQFRADTLIGYKEILPGIYLAGVLFLILKMIRRISLLLGLINKTGITRHGPAKLIRASEFSFSFSFFNCIFINPSVTGTGLKEIINHELAHVRQWHWLDLLLMELLLLLQWINPVAWIYAGFIRQNHEYLADKVALQHTSDQAIYKATLLNNLFSSPVIRLSNSFNNSLNKKRFDMMNKQNSSPYRKLKVLFVLPVFAILFYAFAMPEYQFTVQTGNSAPASRAAVHADREVRGIITGQDDKPIEGATIIVSGTNTGTVTDRDGIFILKGLTEGALLHITFEGYEAGIVKADFSSEMNVKLVKVPEGGPPAPPPPPPNPGGTLTEVTSTAAESLLYVIDGVIMTEPFGHYSVDPATIESISVVKSESGLKAYGEAGKNGVIIITTKKDPVQEPPPPPPPPPASPDESGDENPIYILDGVMVTESAFKSIGADMIQSLTVFKKETAIELYGEKGKYGVIEVITRKQAGGK